MLDRKKVEARINDADRVWFQNRESGQILDALDARVALLRQLDSYREISTDEVRAAFGLAVAKPVEVVTPAPTPAPASPQARVPSGPVNIDAIKLRKRGNVQDARKSANDVV